MTKGKIAITLTAKGIDTVAFVSADKEESLNFYLVIQAELQNFERAIINRIERAKKETTKEIN